jgi:hypothetical protein
MFRNLIYFSVFMLGLAALVWIGQSYLGSNPLAAAILLLISIGYLTGTYELYRYRQASSTLQRAITNLSSPPPILDDWLQHLQPTLRMPVRLRIEGDRVALPGPALTPYLVGLLVLLGMLGTLLGMMATLGGTGLALQSATDLQAIRESIAAPVKGLGFAFGTSIAGVATSAMLGLLSALSRRERLQVVQLLDAKIATSLRSYSQAYQREQTYRLLQQQTEAMPMLVDRLQTMMATIEQHSAAANERQLSNQNNFHERSEATYTRLVDAMEQSLQRSVSAAAQAAATALQPATQDTLTALTSATVSLHATVTDAVQQQLTELSSGFAHTTNTLSDNWKQALAAQQQCNQTLLGDLSSTLNHFSETLEQRSTAMVDSVITRFDNSADSAANAWQHMLSLQEVCNRKFATDNQQALTAVAAAFARRRSGA